MDQDNSMGFDIAAGAAAGAAATLALSAATSAMYAREDRRARGREEQVRGGKSAYEIAAERAAGLAGLSLSSEQEAKAGTLIHYGLGMASTALYASVRRRMPAPGVARGLGFGAALWLVADEGANPLLGLTPGPGAFPWQAHARGLVAHLVFGLTAEAALSAADRLIDGR